MVLFLPTPQQPDTSGKTTGKGLGETADTSSTEIQCL